MTLGWKPEWLLRAEKRARIAGARAGRRWARADSRSKAAAACMAASAGQAASLLVLTAAMFPWILGLCMLEAVQAKVRRGFWAALVGCTRLACAIALACAILSVRALGLLLVWSFLGRAGGIFWQERPELAPRRPGPMGLNAHCFSRWRAGRTEERFDAEEFPDRLDCSERFERSVELSALAWQPAGIWGWMWDFKEWPWQAPAARMAECANEFGFAPGQREWLAWSAELDRTRAEALQIGAQAASAPSRHGKGRL